MVYSKLLVQANSGGGKSFLLRRLLEQTHGQVQHLVIDPEGEFASLREKFDYVHAAKIGGDTAADPRAAALLAERLLELNVSAILDIYELKPRDRVEFVRLFVEALVNAPKSLWHPALVVIDEAHMFCDEDERAASGDVVRHFVSVSRKRGFCPILATQRLSKLHKDAAAECNNKLIGRTTLDVDLKRAAFELGTSPSNAVTMLRDLAPGHFYAYGPAFKGESAGVNAVKVGPVQTHHPKAGGHRTFKAPPPTAAITKLLPNLADLPAEVEERVKSVDALKREVAQLRSDLTRAKHAAPAPETKTVEKFVLKDGQLARAEALVARFERIPVLFQKVMEKAEKDAEPMALALKEIRDAITSTRTAPVVAEFAKAIKPGIPPKPPPPRPAREVAASNGDLTGPQRKILRSLAELRALGLYPSDKQQLGLLAGYTNIRSGGFSEPFGALAMGGYLVSERGKVEITTAGAAAVGEVDPPGSSEELQRRILEKLTGPEQRLLKILLKAYPKPMTKEELAAACDPPYANIRSGGFSEPVSHLNVLGLIESSRGEVAAARALFLEGR